MKLRRPAHPTPPKRPVCGLCGETGTSVYSGLARCPMHRECSDKYVKRYWKRKGAGKKAPALPYKPKTKRLRMRRK